MSAHPVLNTFSAGQKKGGPCTPASDGLHSSPAETMFSDSLSL